MLKRLLIIAALVTASNVIAGPASAAALPAGAGATIAPVTSADDVLSATPVYYTDYRYHRYRRYHYYHHTYHHYRHYRHYYPSY